VEFTLYVKDVVDEFWKNSVINCAFCSIVVVSLKFRRKLCMEFFPKRQSWKTSPLFGYRFSFFLQPRRKVDQTRWNWFLFGLPLSSSRRPPVPLCTPFPPGTLHQYKRRGPTPTPLGFGAAYLEKGFPFASPNGNPRLPPLPPFPSPTHFFVLLMESRGLPLGAAILPSGGWSF